MGPRIVAAKEAQQAASAKCHAVTMAFYDIPQELGAQPPPATFDPMLTDGFASTRVRALHVWRIA
jgi:hypothetical protein